VDVWKGQHHGREVAAKVLRVYSSSDFEQIRKVGYPRLVVFINELTEFLTEVLQEGCNMEDPSSSERVAAFGRNDDGDPVRDGIGVDGEWKHKRVCKGAYRRESTGACTFLVQASHLHLILTIPWLL